jgi:hypothetical protein
MIEINIEPRNFFLKHKNGYPQIYASLQNWNNLLKLITFTLSLRNEKRKRKIFSKPHPHSWNIVIIYIDSPSIARGLRYFSTQES